MGDDAQIQCVDGNLHRKDIPLSELARAAQMKMDALKRRQGGAPRQTFWPEKSR